MGSITFIKSFVEVPGDNTSSQINEYKNGIYYFWCKKSEKFLFQSHSHVKKAYIT